MGKKILEGPKPRPGRQKAWHHKGRTGCVTCKKRKVKCDERHPFCVRCEKADRSCEGYEEVPKPWLFDPAQAHDPDNDADETDESRSPALTYGSSSSSTSDMAPEYSISPSKGSQSWASTGPDISDKVRQWRDIRRHRVAEDISELEFSRWDSEVQKRFMLPYPLTGPYHSAQEQYFFKYFVEVVGAAVSRASISADFWLMSFPQFAWSARGVRYALIAMAMSFHRSSDGIFINPPTQKPNPKILEYETLALRSVVQDTTSTSLEGVLTASTAFWMTAMFLGDWARSLQHAYFCQKIITNIDDASKYNARTLRYCDYLSRAALAYFRTTRGPCPWHRSGQYMACEPRCFVPKEEPLDLRVADMLHHLRNARLGLLRLREALIERTIRHTNHDVLLSVFTRQLRELTFVMRRYTDHKHLGLSANFEQRLAGQVPYTFSPLDPIISDLKRYIDLDEESGLTFIGVEYRVRVALPNILVATARDHPGLLADAGFMVLCGGFLDGKVRFGEFLRADIVSTILTPWTEEDEARHYPRDRAIKPDFADLPGLPFGVAQASPSNATASPERTTNPPDNDDAEPS